MFKSQIPKSTDFVVSGGAVTFKTCRKAVFYHPKDENNFSILLLGIYQDENHLGPKFFEACIKKSLPLVFFSRRLFP